MYEAGIQRQPEPIRRARPRPATIASVLLSVSGGLGVVATVVLLSIGNGSEYLFLLGFLQVLLSATQLVSGVLVWQGRPGARMVAIGLCAFAIIGALVSLSTGAVLPAIIGVVINVALIRLLNDRAVLAWCDR